MSRPERKYHFIYKTTNKLNGKFYIGMHSTDNLNDGYMGSGKYLWRSINKYGKENFIVERLEFSENRKMLAEREKIIVNENLLMDPMCMNLGVGGLSAALGKPHTAEQKKKNSDAHLGISTWNKGMKMSKEFREAQSKGMKKTWQERGDELRTVKIKDAHEYWANVSEEDKKLRGERISESLTGKKLSEDTRKKISKAHKGRIPWNKGKTFSDEYRLKLSESHKGLKRSEESRKKGSDSLKLYYENASNPMTGRKQSEETKRKISEFQKTRHQKLSKE